MTVGACFVPVNGKTIDLTELKVTGYDTTTEGAVSVQTLDEYGKTKKTYYYYDAPSDGLLGWLDGEDVEVAKGDVTIQPGEGLWCMSPSAGFGIQATGIVPTSDIAIKLPSEGGLSVANPTPVSVDLTDIDATGYDTTVDMEGKIYVQVLDEAGRTKATYYYYDVPSEGLLGWLDGKDNVVEKGDVVLKPGEGLWAMAPRIEGISLVFPAVDSASLK